MKVKIFPILELPLHLINKNTRAACTFSRRLNFQESFTFDALLYNFALKLKLDCDEQSARFTAFTAFCINGSKYGVERRDFTYLSTIFQIAGRLPRVKWPGLTRSLCARQACKQIKCQIASLAPQFLCFALMSKVEREACIERGAKKI